MPTTLSPDKLFVRKAEKEDFATIVDYFLKADDEFLKGMGVDVAKLLERAAWIKMTSEDYELPLENRKFFYVLWLVGETPVGHSNINKIIYGEEAYMHLHIWNPDARKKGMGAEFVKASLLYYFDLLLLKNLYCEPNALNPAPNHTLEKLGFKFVQKYDCTPGFINFHQTVNRWSLSENQYQKVFR